MGVKEKVAVVDAESKRADERRAEEKGDALVVRDDRDEMVGQRFCGRERLEVGSGETGGVAAGVATAAPVGAANEETRETQKRPGRCRNK